MLNNVTRMWQNLLDDKKGYLHTLDLLSPLETDIGTILDASGAVTHKMIKQTARVADELGSDIWWDFLPTKLSRLVSKRKG